MMTPSQIAAAAVEIVRSALPYSSELLEQCTSLELPHIMANGDIYGPAPDNAAAFMQYGADWTGLAVSSRCGGTSYWLYYRCQLTQERAMACLGPQQSVGAAIEAAVQHVRADLEYWNSKRAAA
ncbi:hypothetical protein PSOLE_37170 [Pseudomonas oleovorans subsp. oleovorans]|uniref:Uncharacterized protein n=1 Tax=Ectopseudomonas oleovorans TaxID=301 RepID=A0A379PIS4_ECTOL|nr:hypothetical protein [Pseudomonas oleovorans]EPL60769.1 hypothetical protein B382_19540 [Stutzerimonas stutzeri B1SMN1]OZB34651.1 MAG: hypothetical protein B7X51_01285 [Pseudomonas sp. 34-62-33]OWK40684.1 hypothetical protein PSOLE_37170 [Pseudomonas oleovorans subsp. oleovorans]SEJ92122.1 hypothetical protein SAMN05216280_106428 [Pseudomonas oleovorans]SUE72701.1 Uncharacterised protein [Pseudomonas oleovorans]